MKTTRLFTALTLGLIAILAVASPRSNAATRPNVIVMMADDLGYECIGANGSTSYQTPNLDKLAAGGMRFEHAYSQPLCTPTRVQMMTGIYNWRNYVHFGTLEPSQTTFGHLFRDAGYRTGIVGKWQLGGGMEGPKHFGFDEFCMWQLTRRPPRYANPGLEIDGKEIDYTNGEYGPKLVNDYALDFITRHKAEPFFLYYPMILTHSPFQPTPDSPNWDPKAIGERTNQNNNHFADMVAYMDKMIGNIVTTLEKHGLRENTLLIFTGDNGTGKGMVSKMGERTVIGGKGGRTHTGDHVPLIVNWPGKIPAGRVSKDLVDSTDYLPTICEAAGIKVPEKLKIDGHSFLPQLLGKPGTPREWIYTWYAREGGSKADFESAQNQHFKLYRDGTFYDLRADLDEKKPLNDSALPTEAAEAHKLLSAALDKFSGPRPPEIVKQAKAGGEGGEEGAPKKKNTKKGKK